MPPPPTSLREIKKRAPVPRMLPCWGLCYWVGVNEKVQNTGEPMPIFSKVWALLFSSIFFQILSPPIPLTRALLFFLNIGLTQTCIKLLCPLPTWEPFQSSKRTIRKCKIIDRNKAFESQGRGTLLFSLYVGSGPASTVHPKINIRNFKHPKKYSKF